MSSRDDWMTPMKFIFAARVALGRIQLDPASSARANERVLADHYFDKAANGLNCPWAGRVWLNPPYSETKKWVLKLKKEFLAGNTLAFIALLPSFKSDTWQHEAISISSHICFVHKRIQFIPPPGVDASSNNNGSVILYNGNYPEVFSANFRPFGDILS